VELTAVDREGAPVLSARSLVVRPFSADQLAVAGGGRGVERDSLFGLEWTELPARMPGPDAGVVEVTELDADLGSLETAADVVVVRIGSAGAGSVAESVHELTAR